MSRDTRPKNVEVWRDLKGLENACEDLAAVSLIRLRERVVESTLVVCAWSMTGNREVRRGLS